MPFSAMCADHPDWHGDGTTEDAIQHLRSDHTGIIRLDDESPVRFTYVRQTVAQGTVDHHLYRCRRCATMVDTTDPNPSPYCEDCR